MNSFISKLEQNDQQRKQNDRDIKHKKKEMVEVQFDWHVFEVTIKAIIDSKEYDKETGEAFYKPDGGNVVGEELKSFISDLVNSKFANCMSVLATACFLGYTSIVRKLLSFEELDLNYNTQCLAPMLAVEANSTKCFIELTKCEKVDWNTCGVVLDAAYLHRVEMLRALSKVKGVNWNHQNEGGWGVAHHAIMSLMDSCYEILAILLEIPNFNINQRNNGGDTPLSLALKKRDFKSLMMLFQFPNLELKHKDFYKGLQNPEDLDTMIEECYKSYRETGYNYSDVVDFLTEYKKTVESKHPRKQSKKERKGRNRGF